MTNKTLKRYLIKNSFLLFVFYMLSAIILISIYENSTLESLAIRMISIGIVTFLIFNTSAHIIIHFKKNENKIKHKDWMQIKMFLCGYLSTLVIMLLHHFIGLYLNRHGLEMHLPQSLQGQHLSYKVVVYAIIGLLQYTFIYLIQIFTLSQYEKNLMEMQLLKLKSANIETNNELLRQQIQPHFLFNALNTLKSLIKKNPDVAEDYLIRLSDFLRASFSHQSSGLSKVSDELELCSNYMEMQKMRFGESIKYAVDPQLHQLPPHKMIPVFSLQPLVENAIKHNIATIDHPLHIDIILEGEFITVRNNLQIKKTIDGSTGNGLANLKSRYKLIFDDVVKVEQTKDNFTVSIKILENENSHH